MNSVSRGDNEKQAGIRDRLASIAASPAGDSYVSVLKTKIRPGMTILDIGCGTGHIIEYLAHNHPEATFCGLDISPAMVERAKGRSKKYENISIILGDGLNLPFNNGAFDIVATRLAEYAPAEAYRVLKKLGLFIECGLGPQSDKEIREFFPTRIVKENFSLPHDPDKWYDEITAPIAETGFTVDVMTDRKQYDYYHGVAGIMDLIEMVPLVENFDRRADSPIVEELVKKYGTSRGVRITWHYYIVQARRT